MTTEQRRPGGDQGGAGDLSGSGPEAISPATVGELVALAETDHAALGELLRRAPTGQLHQLLSQLTDAWMTAIPALRATGLYHDVLTAVDPELARTARYVEKLTARIYGELDQRSREAAICWATVVYAALLGKPSAA